MADRKMIYLDDAIEAVVKESQMEGAYGYMDTKSIVDLLRDLPSAQPEPLSDAYMNAVWTWLLDYQIKVAELAGRYTPYEVLSWVANDWRKEHEGSD